MTLAAVPRTERSRLRRERRRAAIVGVAVLVLALAATVMMLSGVRLGSPPAAPHHSHAVVVHAAQPAHLAPAAAGVP
jgi:hypothetical protein